MAWWLWIVLGITLAVMEVQVPLNFYLLAFGAGAALTGVLVAAHVIEVAWMEWLSFTLLSIGAVVAVRTLQPERRRDSPRELVGEVAIPNEDLPPGAVGTAELRGTIWSARNTGPALLPKGTRARVERMDGLTLWIRAEPTAEERVSWKS
ncbi:MAG: inner membrane protein [Candidatus Binatota bacterium]|jgi:membrane protein implicated in regulation of membrane protease activity|nr:inner membrane protein [Candidatus Binatota bacterium]